jgi:hypothetical protein
MSGRFEKWVVRVALAWLLAVSITRVACDLKAAPLQDEFRERLTKFHWAYDTFIRAYIGCPARDTKTALKHDGMEAVECDALHGTLDQAAFGKAREAAKGLFDLQEKKP